MKPAKLDVYLYIYIYVCIFIYLFIYEEIRARWAKTKYKFQKVKNMALLKI